MEVGSTQGRYPMGPLAPEQRELLSYLRKTVPLGELERQRQHYLAEGEVALAREIEEVIRGRSPLPEPPYLWTTDGRTLPHEEWWAQRWNIVLTEAGLEALPYREAVARISHLVSEKKSHVHFSVTFANQHDAEMMIAAINAYVAYLRETA